MNTSIYKSKRSALSLVLCALLVITFLLSTFTVQTFATQFHSENKYENLKLIPGGIPFGVKFSTAGVMVIGFCDVDSSSGAQNPAYSSGLRVKDMITKIDGREIFDASELTRAVENCGGKILTLTYTRNGNEKVAKIKPVYSVSEERYKTGVWVRDNGAGIGTVTYILPKNNAFAGLGHGICDSDTGELIPMRRGVVTDVTVSGVKRGLAGAPGEIKGYFGASKRGTLIDNTDCGVYGMYTERPTGVGEAICIGTRNDIRNGEAYIICTLDGSGSKKYNIEISSINRDEKGSKCFTVHVIDDNLISKTGGIVQGMSGSPIIQNGKLVGAVTHVMINDPTTGYGIFVENMLDRMDDLVG